jgi:hypothetical protein
MLFFSCEWYFGTFVLVLCCSGDYVRLLGLKKLATIGWALSYACCCWLCVLLSCVSYGLFALTVSVLGCPGWYAYLSLLPEAFFFLSGCSPRLGCAGHVWLPCLNWLVPSSCKLPQGYLVLALLCFPTACFWMSWAIIAIATHFACFQCLLLFWEACCY